MKSYTCGHMKLSSKKLMMNTTNCDLCLILHKMCLRWSENSVRFEKSFWTWLPGPNSVKFHLTYGMYDTTCTLTKTIAASRRSLGLVYTNVFLSLFFSP